jgi:sigma-E factor negative regulatory protein RseB
MRSAPFFNWLPALTLGLMAGLLPLGGWAQSAGAGTAPPLDARSWLQRIQTAADSVNYRGTMVVSADGMLSSSRVWHYRVGQQRYEKREALDGQQRQVLRHNDVVHTRWPQSRLALVEIQRSLPVGSVSPSAVEPRALQHYQLRHQGQGRVAGRTAEVFLVEPRDGLRYAQRLWADSRTGLMLRVDVLGPQRHILESVSFTEIQIDVRPDPDEVLRDMQSADGYTVTQSPRRPADFEAEGWRLKQPVAGFSLMGCMKRPMRPEGSESLASNRAPQGSVLHGRSGTKAGPEQAAPEQGGPEPTLQALPDEVLQAVYFDGLTHVSLFIEPYRIDRHSRVERARMGATSTVMQRVGEHWVIAIGDVPEATLRQFTQALELRR